MHNLLKSLALVAFVPTFAFAAPNFQDDVLPIFKQHCVGCHNSDKKTAGLDLTSMKALEIGSSGGNVVKAGRPDSSPLFMAVNHHTDYVAMPPNKPKLPANQLKTIHSWIAGGLISSKGGKSQLRELSFRLSAGSQFRPKTPAFPTDLPVIPLAKTNIPLPLAAIASSPWADVVAVSGHEQVLLFGRKTDASQEDGSAPARFQHVGSLPFPEGAIHDLRFSPNGNLLIAAGGQGAESGKVAIFDVKTGKRQATIGDESDVVLSVDISADHKYVAIGTPFKMIKIFSTRDGKLLHRIKKHTDWVTVVRFSPDGKQLASADRNGGIYVWETQNAGIVYTLDEHKVKITALSWRADGKVMASAAEDGKFVLWDMKDGWATRTAPAHTQESQSRYSSRTGVLDVTFARDGRLLTTGRDRTLKLWKTDGTPLKQATKLDSLPLRCAITANGKLAFLGTYQGDLQVWDLEQMKQSQVLRAK